MSEEIGGIGFRGECTHLKNNVRRRKKESKAALIYMYQVGRCVGGWFVGCKIANKREFAGVSKMCFRFRCKEERDKK